ncbi:MAG: hypothetical protein JRG87_10565 [Deltaproteobacteria bacterium]|nr:hypothetical protein [Deltaproteobacteria bacterium]
MSLAKYLKRFSRLGTYKDHKEWFELTTYQASHKPFLLLSIMRSDRPGIDYRKN